MASLARTQLLRQTLTASQFKALPTRTLSALTTRTSRPLAQQLLLRPSIIAPFHATPSRSILPPGPQVIQGTVNDPQPLPHISPMHGSYHWTFERIMSGAMVPLCLAPFIGGALNPVMDSVFCAVLLVHTHIGFQSVIIDYIPVKKMPGIRRLFMWGLNLATVLVGVGLYEFETNDIGVTAAVAKIWTA